MVSADSSISVSQSRCSRSQCSTHAIFILLCHRAHKSSQNYSELIVSVHKSSLAGCSAEAGRPEIWEGKHNLHRYKKTKPTNHTTKRIYIFNMCKHTYHSWKRSFPLCSHLLRTYNFFSSLGKHITEDTGYGVGSLNTFPFVGWFPATSSVKWLALTASESAFPPAQPVPLGRRRRSRHQGATLQSDTQWTRLRRKHHRFWSRCWWRHRS